MKLEQIIDRVQSLGLPLAEYEFQETVETPLPEPPYLVYLIMRKEKIGSDDGVVAVNLLEMAIELYTDRVADKTLEEKIENEVLKDIDYTKYQETIESEDMVQTAYEFTIYEKVRKRGK